MRVKRVFIREKSKNDANCTVQLTGDGNVTYTAGNQVHSFKMITGFPYAKSGPRQCGLSGCLVNAYVWWQCRVLHAISKVLN